MRLLALDLGTRTGFAYGSTEADWPEKIGTWDLGNQDPKVDREINWTRRCVELRQLMEHETDLFRGGKAMMGKGGLGYTQLREGIWRPELIAFENGFHRGPATEFFGGLRWTVRMFAYHAECSFTSAMPSSIKKHLTGKGGSKKPAMRIAAHEKWGDKIIPFSHDEIDAVALWFLIKEECDG